MSMLSIVNAQVVNEGRTVAADVLIRGDRIERIGAAQCRRARKSSTSPASTYCRA